MDGYGIKAPKVERPWSHPSPLRHGAIFPRGPEVFAPLRKTKHFGGPGDPPVGFVTNTTSASEWILYWASMRILDPDRDPRTPPFYGGRLWSYQAQELSRIPGAYAKSISTNIDFLFFLGYPGIAVRLQSYRFHEATDAMKQAYDRTQVTRIAGEFEVRDLFEEDFVGDTTGSAAIVLIKETLGLLSRRNPLYAGNVVLIRPGSESPG